MDSKECSDNLLARYIVESDAIERIVRDRAHVQAELCAGYVHGHTGAYKYLEDRGDHPLTLKMVHRVQSLIVSEQGKYGQRTLPVEWVGKFRKIGVSVGGRICPHSRTVPQAMRKLAFRIRTWQSGPCKTITQAENVRFIAETHFDYLTIHPYADGNGRSSRALVYFLMKYARIEPFIFTSHDRFETYYQCFSFPEQMVKYFESRLAKTKR